MNRLYFFIDEDLRELLLGACGFRPREFALSGFRSRMGPWITSKKYPMPLNVLDVVRTARDVNHIVYRVKIRLRAEWAEQTPVPPGTNPLSPAVPT